MIEFANAELPAYALCTVGVRALYCVLCPVASSVLSECRASKNQEERTMLHLYFHCSAVAREVRIPE